MNYLLQSRKSKKRFRPLIVVAIFILLVVLITWAWPFFFSGASHAVARPFWHSGSFLFDTFANLRAFTTSRRALLSMNTELRQELTVAQAKLSASSVIQKENEELKRAWGRDDLTPGVLASVLVRPPQSFYDTLILDIGEDKGVAVGDKVIVGEMVILGTIDEVFAHTSRAKLFSSVDTETIALVDRSNVSVTLIGNGGGNFEIKAPQELDILPGDIIVLPGMAHNVIGTVLDIESIPANSFKRVLSKVAVNITELRTVAVVK